MVRVSRNLRDAAKLLACAAIAACGSDSGDDAASDGQKRENLIQFPHFYSAFDGSHDFQFTPSVPLADPAADAALDPIVPESVNWIPDGKVTDEGPFAGLPAGRLFKTKASGNGLIKVTGTTKSGIKVWSDAQVTITPATADDFTKGEARYANGNMLDLMNLGSMVMRAPDGEMGLCGAPVSVTGSIPKDSACGNCHNPQNPIITVEHTPTQTAGYSDGDLIQIFTMAQKPAGGKFNSPFLAPLAAMNPTMADCIYKSFHTWEIDEETRTGIVFKLRSLTPKKQEALDFARLRAAAQAAQAGGAAGAAAP